ncbi:MAG: hypothetical protein NTX53_19045 [candidate division WOR-3 bacterium]|nr:hypothetical protein [candidate division WOR-3 bacterium]
MRRTPVVYWSLEIHLASEFRMIAQRIVKRVERIGHRRAMLTVIQDAGRARALLSENGATSQRVVIVPNAPAGPAPRITGSFFRDKFNLPVQQRIILHAGMIRPNCRTLELAQTASTWPRDWTLVLHSHEKRNSSHPYVAEVSRAGQGRVCLSLEPVPYDALDQAMSSAHVGIALYQKALGPNYALMAGASGKLAHYLRCGLPVVCVDFPDVDQLIRAYQCGIVVENLGGTREAIETIILDRETYSRNAVRCYEEVFEFGRYFKHLLRAIEASAV